MEEIFKIDIPLYRERLHVFFGSREECANALRADGMEEWRINSWLEHTKNCDGLYSQHDCYRLLWVYRIPESVAEYVDLVHEVEHAAFYMLKDKGLIHTEESDEAYAYLMGWLYGEIMVFINSISEKNERH